MLQNGQYVKVLIGLYKGSTAKVISVDRADSTGRRSVLVEFCSTYRMRFFDHEVEGITR